MDVHTREPNNRKQKTHTLNWIGDNRIIYVCFTDVHTGEANKARICKHKKKENVSLLFNAVSSRWGFPAIVLVLVLNQLNFLSQV